MARSVNDSGKISISSKSNESAHPSAAHRIRLPTPLDPVEAWERLEGLPGRVLLETGGATGAEDPAGLTLVAAAPRAAVIGRAGQVWLESEGPFRDWMAPVWPGAGHSNPAPMALLGHTIDRVARMIRNGPMGGGADRDPPAGGWIGMLGYELADELESLPAPPAGGPGDLPDLWFGLYDWALSWPGGTAAPPVLSGASLSGGNGDLEDRLAEVTDRLRRARPRGDAGSGTESARSPATTGTTAPTGTAGVERMDPLEGCVGAALSLGRERYIAAVERIRRYIRAGDLFQANLTCRIDRPLPGSIDAAGLYRALRERSPAPYAALLQIGDAAVVSISPESFLERRGETLRTRPIKGTRPRGGTPAEDARLARELQDSEKDQAENVMIVDLLRNDLSKISKHDSVYVSRLCELESHPTVHHLVSEVESRVRPGVGWGEVFQAMFPGGSITGAPKIRAIEILRELEPVRRGPYTGAIGWIAGDGRTASLSIAIRTAVLGSDGIARYGAGGGVTLASDPELEWQEMLDKARAFLEATEPGPR